MLVGEVKTTAGNLHGDRLVAIEREEPDAGSAMLVVDVGADVKFLEP